MVHDSSAHVVHFTSAFYTYSLYFEFNMHLSVGWVAVTATTARALQGIQPEGANPVAPVFGLTGETLANRLRAAVKAAGLGHGFTGHSGRIGMARRMVAAGVPNAAVQNQRCWKNGSMVSRYTRGEVAGEALKWLT